MKLDFATTAKGSMFGGAVIVALAFTALAFTGLAFGAPASALAAPVNVGLQHAHPTHLILAQDQADTIIDDNGSDDSMDDMGENPDASYGDNPGDNMPDDQD